jgi:hypothetical protein
MATECDFTSVKTADTDPAEYLADDRFSNFYVEELSSTNRLDDSDLASRARAETCGFFPKGN